MCKYFPYPSTYLHIFKYQNQSLCTPSYLDSYMPHSHTLQEGLLYPVCCSVWQVMSLHLGIPAHGYTTLKWHFG